MLFSPVLLRLSAILIEFVFISLFVIIVVSLWPNGDKRMVRPRPFFSLRKTFGWTHRQIVEIIIEYTQLRATWIPARTIEMSRINQTLILDMSTIYFPLQSSMRPMEFQLIKKSDVFFFPVFRVRYQWSIIDRFFCSRWKQCHIHRFIFTISS